MNALPFIYEMIKKYKLLILLLLIACSNKPEVQSVMKTTENTPPKLINYELEDIIVDFYQVNIPTNSNSVNIEISANLSYSLISFFSNENCTELLNSFNFANYQTNYILDNFNINNTTSVYYKIKLNEEETNCLNSNIKIIHSNIPPEYPLIGDFINNNFQGKTIGESIIKIGGDSEDLPENLELILIYRDFNGNQLIGEYSLNEFLSKNILLNLIPNSLNSFYLKGKDYFGNFSQMNPFSILIEQSDDSNFISKPILDTTSSNLNNKYTNQLIISIKGFLDFKSLYLNIYSDENKTNLIKSVDKSLFELSGVNLDLIDSSLNEFWISASNNSIESELIYFSINHTSNPPLPPILDNSILNANNQIIDTISVQVFGYVPPNIDFVYIYNTPELNNDPLFIISREDFNNNTGIPFNLNFGNNYLYFVSIDFNNLKSQATYIQVFVEE